MLALAFTAALVMGIAVLCVAVGMSPGVNSVDVLEARLRQFGETGRHLTLTEVEMTLPFSDRVIKPFFDRIGHRLSARQSVGRQQALQERLNLAGRPYGLTVGGYLVLQIIGTLAGLGLGYLLGLLLALDGVMAWLAAAFGAGMGFYLPRFLVGRKVAARRKELLLGLPSALDLLTISVEAGLGLDAALTRVTEKYKNALATEFTQVLGEIRLGRSRHDSMADMGRRCHVEELNNFIQAVIQSEDLGVGIANVLRIQSEEIRRRRRQRAEEQGQKAPLKMLFPMIGCIFPTLFIVLLGPAAIQIGHSFGGSGGP
jgi:tight adherence protein C